MTISPIYTIHSLWRVKLLIFWNCTAAILLMSLFSPWTIGLWKSLDVAFFGLIHPPLGKHHFLRVFWALANHRIADWIEDLFILGFYILAIAKAEKGLRKRRGAEFFFCILLTALTILVVDRVICRDLLRLRRFSPTLMLNNAVPINDFLPWIMVKTDSTKSFPGDHATTALMFAFSYAYLIRGKLGIIALLYGGFLCLPRLVVGAHWLSDILVGSGCIVMFILSWAFCTPFADYCIQKIQRIQKKLFP